MNTGVLPFQHIQKLLNNGVVISDIPSKEADIQPASLDLRLGATAYRIRASFLPGKQNTVQQKIDQLQMYQFSLKCGAVLEQGCVYLIPLQESLSLPDNVSAYCNPKSSTGRLDVFTRTICDFSESFEYIPHKYKGKLYLEVSPRTFSVLVREGDTLNQVLFLAGNPRLNDEQIRAEHAKTPLVYDKDGNVGDISLSGGVSLSVDLSHNDIVGYRAKKHAGVIDLQKKNYYELQEFWQPIYAHNGEIILDPDEFYILMSKEAVCVPDHLSCEMLPYDTLVGEFRAHYAGFFDPGFGFAEENGSRAVLEVRAHEVPFVLRDGQKVCKMAYDTLVEKPEKLYGYSIGSNYQGQTLKLGKQFRMN